MDNYEVLSLVLAILTTTNPAFSFGRSHHPDVLIQNGKPVHGYNRKVRGLEVGSVIGLQCAGALLKEFTVARIVNPGVLSPSKIIETTDQHIVRIPRWRASILEPISTLFHFYLSPMLLDFPQMVKSHAELVAAGAPIVRLHTEAGPKQPYLVLDNINVQLTWGDLLSSDLRSKLGTETWESLEKATIEFVRRTSKFASIAGLGSAQLVYGTAPGETVAQWWIINWEPNHRFATSEFDENIFSDTPGMELESRFQSMSMTPGKIAKKLGIPTQLSDLVSASLQAARKDLFNPEQRF